MKDWVVVFFNGFVIIFFMNTCRYKEGPLMSFRTPEGRITGVWELEEYKVNETDSTQYMLTEYSCEYIFRFSGNEKVLESICGNNRFVYGEWYFAKNKRIRKKTELKITLSSPPIFSEIGPFVAETVTWKILELTNKKMRLTTTDNGNSYYLEFIKAIDLPNKPEKPG